MIAELEPAFDPSLCAVCGDRRSTLLFERRDRAFTSDGRTLYEPLVKVECSGCGAVRRGNAFTAAARARHYEKEYQLASRAAVAEPMFYSSTPAVPRSQAIFAWFETELTRLRDGAPRSVLEVGAGEGRLLARVGHRWPAAQVTGLDLGYAGRAAGVDVRRGSYLSIAGAFDLVLSFAVLEHVASPGHFLSTLRRAISDDGLLAVALPRLEAGSRELLFCDHLHHLSASHMARLAQQTGLHVAARSIGPAELGDFALYVLEKSRDTSVSGGTTSCPASEARPADHALAWDRRFREVDRWLDARRDKQLVVWGVGEAFGLFATYSTLGDRKIWRGLDDNSQRFTGGNLEFPVCRLEDLPELGAQDVVVLMTFTPPPAVQERLARRKWPWFDPISLRCSC
jgi:SAM-dependent methyltransferase